MFLLLFADDNCSNLFHVFGFTKPNGQLRKSVPVNGTDCKFRQNESDGVQEGGYLTARVKCFYCGTEIEVVNSYKYLGFTLTTQLSSDCAREDYMPIGTKARFLVQ